jgi:hypothetical protein
VVEKKTILIMMNWQNILKKQARGLTECDVAEDATPNEGQAKGVYQVTTHFNGGTIQDFYSAATGNKLGTVNIIYMQPPL